MIRGDVRRAAARRILFLPHAIRQMSRPERMITPAEVRAVVETGEVIEDYPNDPRGHSCVVLGQGEGGRVIHVVCSPKEDYLAIITAYVPSKQDWEPEFRARRTK